MRRRAGFWTVDKLDFLEKYIPAFVKATKSARNRYYVDGFAGPGINEIEYGGIRRGSPLIALDQEEFERLWFVEKKRKPFLSLSHYVENHRNKKKVILINNNFNIVLPHILSEIHTKAPTFFLLDPEGLELEWSSIKLISSREKADIFVLVSASGVLRNAPRRDVHARLTKFYGGEEWKNVERYRRPGYDYFEAYLEIYLEKLKSLGFEYVERFLIARNSKKTKMHALVFAAKHPLAIKIASDVLEKLKDPGMDPLY